MVWLKMMLNQRICRHGFKIKMFKSTLYYAKN